MEPFLDNILIYIIFSPMLAFGLLLVLPRDEKTLMRWLALIFSLGTLALIGAIVAEFFGSPTRGMGFRISTEVGVLGLDMVWAEITVAAMAGGCCHRYACLSGLHFFGQ